MKQLDIQTVCSIIASQIGVSPEDAGLDENTELRECGLESMDFVLCLVLIEEQLGVSIHTTLPLRSIRTLGELVVEVNRELGLSK